MDGRAIRQYRARTIATKSVSRRRDNLAADAPACGLVNNLPTTLIRFSVRRFTPVNHTRRRPMMSSITISDWLIILATVCGPILAVQAQKFIERTRARRETRLSIFYRLMTFRATPLAPERIQALNMIDLEFRPNWLGRQSTKDKAVTTAWKNLLDELDSGPGIAQDVPNYATIAVAWQKRCDELRSIYCSRSQPP